MFTQPIEAVNIDLIDFSLHSCTDNVMCILECYSGLSSMEFAAKDVEEATFHSGQAPDLARRTMPGEQMCVDTGL